MQCITFSLYFNTVEVFNIFSAISEVAVELRIEIYYVVR